jgi:hypothetical protein
MKRYDGTIKKRDVKTAGCNRVEHRQKIIEAAHSFAPEIPQVQFLSVRQTLTSE